MADIYGSHFEYGGVSSRRYGLYFVAAGTTRNTMVSGSISSVTVFNKAEKRRYLSATSYDESPLTYDVEIVTDYDGPIPQNERREIEKWLFNREDYKKLYLDKADDTSGDTVELINGETKRLYMNARFINAERMEYNGGVAGYRATIEADSGWWWQDEVSEAFTFDGGAGSGETITLTADTDIDDYIYPKVTIVTGDSGGEITIVNTTDDEDRETKFVELTPSSTITMRGGVNYVSGTSYQKMYKMNFPRLMDGENTIRVTGDIASMTIAWNNRRNL